MRIIVDPKCIARAEEHLEWKVLSSSVQRTIASYKPEIPSLERVCIIEIVNNTILFLGESSRKLNEDEMEAFSCLSTEIIGLLERWTGYDWVEEVIIAEDQLERTY